MKKIYFTILELALPIMLFAACSGNTNTKSTLNTSKVVKPSTWIANRTLTCRAFIDDLGGSLPTDQENNAVAKKIKALTGMSVNFQYTAGTSDLDVMTTAIAAGDLPDFVVYYLNDSSRPEFPIMLKASREGMFTNVTPLLKKTQVYSKYFEKGFLPDDTKNNIMFRPEFNGAAYMVHMNIPRVLSTTVDINTYYKGGMYIQKSIADKLHIDPRTIKTQDQLYNLLVKIKAGNFKDSNGNPVYPLGPKYWGGTIDSAQYDDANDYFGVSSGFNILNGKVVHEAQTDYVYKQIDFYRKLLKQGLINPEYFTMDGTRAQETSASNSSAIIGDVNNYVGMFKNSDYLPVGPLNNYNGNDDTYTGGKSGYCAWSIPTTTKNPDQVVKFLDFLASKQGKLIWQYGIQGVDYNMVKGNPVPTKSILNLIKAGNQKALDDTGIYLGGAGAQCYDFIGSTDVDTKADFGESTYGLSADPHEYDFATKQVTYNLPKIKYVDGFSALGYLPDLPNIEPNLRPLIDGDAYDDIRVKAIFAKNDTEVKKIIENYRAQLKTAGIQQFEDYLLKVYKADPKSINFIS